MREIIHAFCEESGSLPKIPARLVHWVCLNRDVEPHERLTALIFGFIPAQLVYLMARLRLADLVADGPMTIDELSSATNTRPDMLLRVMRGLQGLGLVGVESDGRISVTEIGALLGSDAAGSLRHVALHGGAEANQAWGRLEHTVRTGEPAFEAAFGEPFFSYLRSHPEAGAAFDGMMSQLSRRVIAAAVADYDFSAVSRVLDVGGGLGHFVAAVLTAYPAQGAVFDVPEVAEEAANYLARADVADRCVAVGGNFFESLPAGFDAHLLKWILHDWNDDSCRKLLKVCRAALPDHGRLLVVERLLPKEISTSVPLNPAIAMDLGMLVNFGDARERYLDEYEELLGSCGFAVREMIGLPSGFSVLDCRPRVA
jgi:orsellinic acid C2-O-methyltransferase